LLVALAIILGGESNFRIGSIFKGVNMQRSIRKTQIILLVLMILVLLTGCSQEAEPTPDATQTPAPLPFEVTYCDINPSDMCLDGFGTDADGKLLILFKADDRFFADIYIRAKGPEDEIYFECQQSENFLENVYCLGEPYPEQELIKLNIYSKINNALIAIGVFNVEYSDLPAPDVTFGADMSSTPFPEANTTPTPSLEPSYPNPSYPNPSYPNPTSTP
jgi:hypothetical protein